MIDRSRMELLNRPRLTQGCRVNRKRRLIFKKTTVGYVYIVGLYIT